MLKEKLIIYLNGFLKIYDKKIKYSILHRNYSIILFQLNTN